MCSPSGMTPCGDPIIEESAVTPSEHCPICSVMFRAARRGKPVSVDEAILIVVNALPGPRWDPKNPEAA